MAAVILKEEVKQGDLGNAVEVESAATFDWHLNEPMYAPAREELERHGYSGAGHQSRLLRASWLARYDLVLAVDRENLTLVRGMALDADTSGRVRLLRSFATGLAADDRWRGDVPDPYGGTPEVYALAFELMRDASKNLVRLLQKLPGVGVREQA
jgi:protein-tyrosine phosphatase